MVVMNLKYLDSLLLIWDLLTITQSGVLVLSTQSAELTGSAPVGGIYFTSGSFFVGLESQ